MRMPGSMQGAPDTTGRKYAQDKSPIVAVILSFLLSGLGQLYNGDFKKFLLIWGICIVFIIIAVATGGVASFLLLGIWLWGMIDAYRVASRQAPLM
jgi:TM2 domain-containing membrane protein YozV